MIFSVYMLTKESVIEALKTVKDPEVHLDVWTMGLIYNIAIQGTAVDILMTYTTPFCPWGPDLQENIKSVLTDLGFTTVTTTITFDPPYTMPPDLRASLGI
jgi:metal-sulfur cluster biosynthetic enzyme